MEIFDKEVRFDIYCPKCIHEKQDEAMDPCNECLAHPVNENTAKPINFKEA